MSESEHEKHDEYVIPGNYNDRGGLFGYSIKPRNFIEGILAAGFTAVLLLPFVLSLGSSIIVKTVIIFIPCILLLLVGTIGYHEEPWSTAFLYLVEFRKHKRKLLYQLPGVKNDAENKKENRRYSGRHKNQ